MRSRQEQASNQPLDVAAEVDLQWRPVLQTDAILLTTTLQRARMKLLRVVEMNHCGQAADHKASLAVVMSGFIGSSALSVQRSSCLRAIPGQHSRFEQFEPGRTSGA